MSVSPAQKSMSGTTIFGALIGGPAVGSQMRGMPIVSDGLSVLPQAKIFPFGNRAMCSGAIAQSTTGPHSPTAALLERGESVTGEEVTVAGPDVNRMVCSPVPLMPRLPNAATPLAS